KTNIEKVLIRNTLLKYSTDIVDFLENQKYLKIIVKNKVQPARIDFIGFGCLLISLQYNFYCFTVNPLLISCFNASIPIFKCVSTTFSVTDRSEVAVLTP